MPSYPIVGARYHPPAQAVLDNLPAGTKLLLRRQPDNPYDGNAVQVLLPEVLSTQSDLIKILVDNGLDSNFLPLHLGFIPRESAAKLAPMMDQWNNKMSAEYGFGDVAYEPCEWPATLTFAAHGGPMVTFDEIK